MQPPTEARAPGPAATLRVLLDRTGALGPDAALVVFVDILGAMTLAHDDGVFHPDLTAESVLVDSGGHTVVAGFVDPDYDSTPPPSDESVLGAPRYRAPERWAGLPPTRSSDIYAATAVCYEALTGRPPFDAPDLLNLRIQHERGAIPLDVPRQLNGVFAAGLAKHAQERPPSAREFLREVRIAASAGYGPDWPERGRAALMERTAPLLAALPGAPKPRGGPVPPAWTSTTRKLDSPLAPPAVASAGTGATSNFRGGPGRPSRSEERAAQNAADSRRKKLLAVVGGAAAVAGLIGVVIATSGGASPDSVTNASAPGSSSTGTAPASTSPPGALPTVTTSSLLGPSMTVSKTPSKTPTPTPSQTTTHAAPPPPPPVTTTSSPQPPGPASATSLSASASCQGGTLVVDFSTTTTTTSPMTVTVVADDGSNQTSTSASVSGQTSYQQGVGLYTAKYRFLGISNSWNIRVSAPGASTTTSQDC